MKNEIWDKKNDSRGRFLDIGLENVAVAAARVVELLPRSGLQGVNKRVGLKASKSAHTGTDLNTREKPNTKLCLGNDPIVIPQTRILLRLGANNPCQNLVARTWYPRSGSQDGFLENDRKPFQNL